MPKKITWRTIVLVSVAFSSLTTCITSIVSCVYQCKKDANKKVVTKRKR